MSAREDSMSPKEERDRLGQLFGEENAAKIMSRAAASSKQSTAAPPAEEILMLQEGMQSLKWGAIRLVDVDMAPGPLEASFEPLLPASVLVCVRLDLPLGMLLEESETGCQVVAELLDGGSARAGGVQEGDLVRATTAVFMGMTYPTWNLMLGGVGKPALQKALMPTLGEPVEKVMAAIGSNARAQQGNGQIVLLLERPTDEA
jgi:hypothetical protein